MTTTVANYNVQYDTTATAEGTQAQQAQAMNDIFAYIESTGLANLTDSYTSSSSPYQLDAIIITNLQEYYRETNPNFKWLDTFIPEYDGGIEAVAFDPFLALEILDANGNVIGVESAASLFVHELMHNYDPHYYTNPQDREFNAIQMTNAAIANMSGPKEIQRNTGYIENKSNMFHVDDPTLHTATDANGNKYWTNKTGANLGAYTPGQHAPPSAPPPPPPPPPPPSGGGGGGGGGSGAVGDGGGGHTWVSYYWCYYMDGNDDILYFAADESSGIAFVADWLGSDEFYYDSNGWAYYTDLTPITTGGGGGGGGC